MFGKKYLVEINKVDFSVELFASGTETKRVFVFCRFFLIFLRAALIEIKIRSPND
jgi:hypothetical protein